MWLPFTGSGIQVLPPLAPTEVTSKSQYCAYTGDTGNAFDAAINDMDEVGLKGCVIPSVVLSNTTCTQVNEFVAESCRTVASFAPRNCHALDVLF